MKKVLTRDEVEVLHTWDLTRLFKTEADYEQALDKLVDDANLFNTKFQGKLVTSNDINESLTMYHDIIRDLSYVSSYQSLHSSSDQRNIDNTTRSGKFGIIASGLNQKLNFYISELILLDDEVLIKASKENKDNELTILEIIEDKKHALDPVVSEALSQFQQVLNAPYKNYNNFKFADMTFPNFEANGKMHENSFTLFENEYSSDTDHELRRKSFESFYDVLKTYENGFASNYETVVLKEKAMANLKGFDSVIDYLLYDQKVSRDMYDRQIDLIMEHLAKPMRKFVKLIKDAYKLDKLTYADLHLALDSEFEPTVTIEKSKEYAVESLRVLGDDYIEMVERSFNERWIDFPQSLGKSTGGFCSSPYNKGAYILLNWNDQMNETFVLNHELGHAGHFYFSGKNQNYFNVRPSLYAIEAPSTMNELLMADYLKTQNDDTRFNRWVLSSLISRTYYHNFVTHLLEAAYQREVYLRVDNKQPLNAQVLNDLKVGVIRKFWGDVVEVPDYAGRTWMRQPHYFMGLYPYTYSAGLTISTAAHKKIKNNELDITKWLDLLKAGGTLTPLELAKIVDVDLSTEQPLMDTIEEISDIIDEIEKLTNKLNK